RGSCFENRESGFASVGSAGNNCPSPRGRRWRAAPDEGRGGARTGRAPQSTSTQTDRPPRQHLAVAADQPDLVGARAFGRGQLDAERAGLEARVFAFPGTVVGANRS